MISSWHPKDRVFSRCRIERMVSFCLECSVECLRLMHCLGDTKRLFLRGPSRITKHTTWTTMYLVVVVTSKFMLLVCSWPRMRAYLCHRTNKNKYHTVPNPLYHPRSNMSVWFSSFVVNPSIVLQVDAMNVGSGCEH